MRLTVEPFGFGAAEAEWVAGRAIREIQDAQQRHHVYFMRAAGSPFHHRQPAPIAGAKLARERLRCIIAQDREAVPAWRWELSRPRIIGLAFNSCAMAVNSAHAAKELLRLSKPRWAWRRR